MGATIIKVSGIPTGDTIIVLPAATLTETPDPDGPEKPEVTYVEVKVINNSSNGIKWNSNSGNEAQTVSGSGSNTSGTTTGNTSSSVKTGDDTSVFVYILGVLLSAGAILIVSRKI